MVSETQVIGSWSLESFRALQPQQRFLFFGLAIVGILIVTALGFLSYFLAVRRQWKLVLFLSIIALTAIPVGTVLGLVTVLIVTRPTARTEFS